MTLLYKHVTPSRRVAHRLVIAEHRFEVKTASLVSIGTLQFNRVRLDRTYDYLLCLGICPDKIVFNAWRR